MFRVIALRSTLAFLALVSALYLPPVTFAQQATQVCDCDSDGDIDKVDINLIANARGQQASGPTDPRDPDRDNVISSADARTCTLRCTFAQCASPTNRPPIADAGPDQTVFTGQPITLDGSDSTDPDGDPLTFRWSFVRKPAGSVTVLTAATSVSPQFTPDVDGIYEIQLIVNDGQVDSAPDTVIITTGNAPPVADAGDDKTALLNQLVTLDGSGSSDINGDPLTFSWSFVSRPADSIATLSSSTAVMPTFTPDRTGIYRLQLIVNDGQVNSAPDEVVIDTRALPNEPPVADAGDDQTVDLATTVTLDGSKSHDPDGDPLTFTWSVLTRPAGSTAVLSSPSAIGPTFVADRAGEYVIQLIVNDGQVNSAPDTVRITTRNTRPVADAGDDQTRTIGDTVTIDGTGSFDSDGDPLTYSWSFTSRPTGSNSTIANPTQTMTSFVADVAGMYVVQLVVNDGQFDSLPDTATITINASNLNRISVDDLTVTEGNSGARNVTFTVRRANPSGSSTVAFQTANGTATIVDNDYASNSGTVTFGTGVTSQPVSVSVIGDTRVEPDETFFLNLSNPSANASIVDPQATGTITNDDTAALPTITITATDAAAAEAGLDSGAMRVTRSGGNNTLALSVSTARSGTAINATDYASIGSTIVIPAGAAFVDVTVTPIDDALVEGDETVIMTLVANASYIIGAPNSATVTIGDNESLPTVSITATDAAAAEAGPSTGTMRVTRSGGNNTLALSVSTARSGTAINATDYASIGSAIVIPAGAAFVDVTVTPIDDALVEGDETVIMTLVANASYIIGAPNSATVTIGDNESLPTVSITATDAAAAEAGPSTGTMRVTRSGGNNTLALSVSTARSGTAINATDYASIGSAIVIPAGAAFVDVTVTPIDDALVEGDETVIMTLVANASYIIGAPNSATVTIGDNESLPTLSITATDAAAAEAGLDPGAMRITRSGGNNALALTVFLSATGSTAANVTDYTGVNVGGSAVIPAGAAFVDLTFTPVDDALVEGNETIVRTINANAAYVVGTPNAATVTIADNESLPTLSITATDAAAAEAGLDPGAMRITRSGGNNALALTVFLSATGSTAANVTDYTGVNVGGSAVIPAGAAFVDLTFTPVDDALVEGNETIVRTINANAAYVVGTPNAATVTIADNESLPTLSITATDAAAAEAGLDPGAMRITRSGGNNALALTVFLSATGSTAANVTDYTGVNVGGSAVIPAGAAFVDLTFTPVDDALVEGNETIVRTINANAAYVVGAPSAATVTIADNESLPTLSITATDAAAAEAGLDPGAMRITRSGGNSALALTVFLSATGSTAANVTDYTGVNVGGSAVIPAGAAFVDLTFTPVDDALVEGNETIVRTINANAAYVVGAPSAATVTIADNESLPTLSITATDAAAAEAGLDPGAMRITRSGGNSALALTVFLSATGSTAANVTDYTGVNVGGSAVIPAGAAFVDLTFTPVDDALVEGNETIVRTINANAAYVVGTPNAATVTIADNDLATVTVVATDASASETAGNPGTLTISRTGPTTAALLVVGNFSGTATNGTDYGPNPANVNIPIGQSSVTVTITPIDDTADEPDETVIYTIQAGTYLIGAQNAATVTIADNDTATLPTVTLVATDAAASETSPNPGRFTITRTGPTTSALTVNFSVGGSATSGSDFTAIGTGVTIASGQSTGVVDINPIDDSLVEAQETVALSIIANAAYTIGAPSSGTVTIADNDVGALVQFVSPTLDIGQNLQVQERVRVAAGNAPAGGLALRIVSSSPNVLLSATPTGTGAQTLNVTILANTAESPTFYVYSLASVGTASLTVEIVTTPNPGFSPGTPASVTMAPVGYELLCQQVGCTVTANGHGINTTAQAAPSLIYIQAQRLTSSATSNRAGTQNVRGGTTINLPLALTNSSLGVFRASNGGVPGAVITSLSIPAGEYYTPFFFDPTDPSSGNGTITFTKPAGAGTPLNNSVPYAQSMPVAVAGSTLINFGNPTQTIGRDLQIPNYVVLGAPAPAGGLRLRLTSENANAIMSSSPTAAGAQTLDITVAAGTTQSAQFYVQSLASSGTANVTVQVLTTPNPGFAGGTPYVATLAPSGFQLFCYSGPGTCTFDSAANRDALTTINSNPNKLMYIEAYYLNPANAANNIVGAQNVRGGFTVTMALSLTNSGVGVLRDYPNAANVITQISIPGGEYFSYFYFDPNNSSTGGSGVLNYTKPATAGTPTAGGTPRRQSMSVTVTQ